MPFTPAPGTNLTQHIVFNSGTIDFGGQRVVMVDNVQFALEYALAPLFVLGSIEPQYYARHTMKVTLSAKIKSMAPSVVGMVAGSSGLSAPTQYSTLDGQATQQNPVVTFFDAVGNQFQYQLSNAVFKSWKHSARMEDYSEFDFELEAMDVAILSTTAL